VQDKKGDYKAAEDSFSEAYFIALAIRHDQEAAEAAAGLVAVVGFRQARHEEGLAWGRHADAAVQRVGEGAVEEARVLGNLGLILGAQGKHHAAAPHHERALAIWEQVHGPDHPNVAVPLNNLGMGFEAQGKFEEARTYYERALAIKEKALGGSHPDVSVLLNNLGMLLETEGKYDEAVAHYERALSNKERTLGPDHPSVAISLNNLGIVLGRLGRYDEALRAYERSLTIFEGALGSDHPIVAHPLTGLGETYIELQQPEKAIENLERALTIRTAKRVAARDLAATHFTLARALWRAGRERRRAITLAEQARDGFREAGDAGKEPLSQVEKWLGDPRTR
jgi:tetratricopeptide (TPR) repeat protein